MYCQKCGKEIDDEAVVCIHCGCATKNQMDQTAGNKDSDVRTSVGLVILSILFPIVGIILGVVYRQSYNETRRRAGKTYLVAALIPMGILFLWFLIGISISMAYA